jgi:hypothetical protein
MANCRGVIQQKSWNRFCYLIGRTSVIGVNLSQNPLTLNPSPTGGEGSKYALTQIR